MTVLPLITRLPLSPAIGQANQSALGGRLRSKVGEWYPPDPARAGYLHVVPTTVCTRTYMDTGLGVDLCLPRITHMFVRRHRCSNVHGAAM